MTIKGSLVHFRAF